MGSDTNLILGKLNQLIALDLDAMSSYESAILRISSSLIRDRLDAFRRDHERHVQALSKVVQTFGGVPRTRQDVTGLVLQAFTAVTAMMGDEAALRAMRANEELTNRTYRNALEDKWPASVHSLVLHHYDDELRHLMTIKDLIEAGGEEVAPA